MDAKAKVVPYSPRIIQTFKEALVAFRADPDGKWISRTDHEAALAEARRTAEYWKAEHLAGNARLDALRSGLEALAGEWLKEPLGQYEYDQGHAEGMHDCGNELRYRLSELRTLASAGLEGKTSDQGN